MGYDWKKIKKNLKTTTTEREETNKGYDWNKIKRKTRLETTINFDTIDSDLKALSTTVESIYNGWQPQETMNKTKADIVSMQERLNAYQEYAKLFGGSDVTELASSYKTILDDWDNRAITYGKFKTAEDYTKAAEREKSLPTADLNTVSTEIADLDKQLAEIKAQKEKFESEYIANGGYIPLATDQNAALYDEDEAYLEWKTKTSEYDKQIKDLESKKADKQAYYEDAKTTQETLATIQKETALASDPNNMEGYNQYIANYNAARAKEQEEDANIPWYGKLLNEWLNASGSGGMRWVDTKKKDKSWQLPQGDWSDDEKRVLGGYFVEDPQKAIDYVVKKNNEKAKATQGETEKGIQGSATSNVVMGAAHTVGAIATAPLGIFDYMDDLADVAAGRPIIEESFVTPFEYSQAVTSGVSTHLNDVSGTLNENIPVIGGKGLGDVYGLGTSVLQSAASAYTLGGVGTLISYFGQGAAAGVDDALSRGATNEQALTYGLVLGAAEGVSEMIGADKLLKLGSPNEIRKILVNGFKKGGGKAFWSLVDKQGKAEAIEEAFSGIAGQVADNFILKGKSNFDALTRQYRAEGLSAAEAQKKAWMQSIGDVAYDALGGYISGAVHAGPQIAVSAVKQNAENKTIGKEIRGNERVADMLNIASLSPQEPDAYEAYTRYAEQGVNAENITDGQLGNLYNLAKSNAVTTLRSKKVTAEQKAEAQTALNRLSKMKTENKAAKIAKELLQTEDENAAESGKSTLSEREIVINEQAKGMSEAEANLFRSVDDGHSNASDYADSFNLVVAMAQNEYDQDYILEHRGVLSTAQVNSIYQEVVTNPKMAQQKRLDALIQEQGDNLEIKGTIDDSVIDYDNTGADGKVNWGDLHPNVKATIAYIAGFSTKVAGMDIQLVTNGRDYGFTGQYDRQVNTMLVDITALAERVKSADSKGRKDNARFIVSTVAHEVTHWMEEKAKELYAQYDKMVMDALTSNGRTEAEVLARRRGLMETAEAKRAKRENRKPREITDKEVRREVIARASEDMLALSEEGKKFFESLTENEQKQFVDKIKEVIQNIKDWISNVLSKLTSSAPEAQELRALAKDLDAISKKWDEMLRQSAKVNAAMKKAGVNDKAIMEAKTDVGTQYASIDEKYWRTGFSKAEFKELMGIAKYELGKSTGYIDNDNKWLYNNRNGKTYFAIYSTIDVDNPTILYASKGKTAEKENQWFKTFIAKKELFENGGNDLQRRTINRVLVSLGYALGESGVHSGVNAKRRGNNRNVGVRSGASGVRPSAALLNCLENIAKIQERESGVIQYSDIDTEYMDAVERGNMGTPNADIDTYTTKQYDDFGWVAVNKVLTGKELKKLYSQFAKVKLNKEQNFKNKLGEYLIPVGDRYGSIDKIVYIKGTNKHPIIRQIVEIKKPYRVNAEKIVTEVMDYEATGLYYDAFEIYESYARAEVFTVHKTLDYPSHSELKRGTRGQDGTRTYVNDRERNNGKRISENRTGEVRSNDGEVSHSDIDEYTEEQYNTFGWATYNGVINANERETLLSRYADFKHNRNKYPVTRWGEAVIHSTETPDVIMYVKGSINAPEITRIVRIMATDIYDVDTIRNEVILYEQERILQPHEIIESVYGEGILRTNKKRDFASFQEYRTREQGRNGRTLVSDSKGLQYRERGLGSGQESGRADSKNITKPNTYYSDIDEYTEEQYNAFGWATYNGVINANERETLLSRYADFKHNHNKYPVTRWGEVVIYSTETPDVIMYVRVSSTIGMPEITKIVRINTAIRTMSEDDVTWIREEIVNNERNHSNQPFKSVEDYYGYEFSSIHKARNHATFREYQNSRGKGESSKAVHPVSKELQNGARGNRSSQESGRADSKNITKPNTYYSDIDDEVDIYEMLGENKRLNKENKALREDFDRLMERLKLERQLTHGNHFNENQLGAVAGHIRNIANSNYSKPELVNKLKEVYTYLATSNEVTWDNLFARLYGIAEDVLRESRPTYSPNDYYANIYRDMRSTEISLSDEQKKYVKDMLGVDWHKAFFGKIKVSDKGTPLNSKWEEWAGKYPNEFTETQDKNQVLELLEIYETAKELKEVVEEYNDVERTRWLANEIYNQYWNVSPIRTTADKYDQKIKRLNYEHRNAMKELRDSYTERLENRKKADRAERSRIFKKLREDHIKELQEIRQSGKERLDKYKEEAARKTRIQSITAQALTLNEWLVKNSKDKHIHESMKGPVVALLQAIDFSSKRALGMWGGDMSGVPTNKDISLQKALSQVKDMMAEASVGKEELVLLYGHELDADIAAMVDSVDNIIRTVGDNEFILNKMTLDDLITLDNVVKTIKHAVTQMNKFHVVNHAKGIANLAQEEIGYAEKLGKANVYRGKSLKAGVKKLLAWKNINPYYAFKRFGAAGKKIFEAFQDGYDKFAFNIKEIIDFTKATYTRQEVREWEKEVKSFKVRVPATENELSNPDYEPQYQEIQMTVAQIMDLYLLNKREAARVHLLGGGIRIADIETKKGEVISQAEGVLLEQKEIDEIIGSLTQRQIEVADKLSNFMNTISSAWGNEVSMARFGYKAFGEKNYVPMQVDKNNLALDDEAEKSNSLFRLLNMSFTKNLTENASNRLVVSSIFDVFAQHTSDMAKYNALALPVLDAFRWYNYKEKGFKGNTAYDTKSVKQAIENAFGKDGQSYITTFLKDLNGQENTSRDTVGRGFLTRAKVAAVAANLRVALLQPTAYLKASANIGNKYLIKALGHKPKVTLAEKYCGMALWKSLGYFDTNVQRGVADQIKHAETPYDKAVELSMKGAEWGDKITFGYLWNAAELEIREKRKDLKVGSEEFYFEVGKRLRDIIYSTQVVDSVMTRSEMMRSPDWGDKLITTFASEPTLAYNMLADAVLQYTLDVRELGKKAAREKNNKHIARVFVAYTTTNLVAALIESGFDVLRDDDDEEMDFAEFMKLYLENFATNQSILAKIPWLNEAVSIMQGFTSTRMDTQGLQTFTNTLKQVMKLTQGDGSWGKTIKSGVQTASYLSGLPFYNAWRDLWATIDQFLVSDEELEEILKDFY